MIGLLQRVLVTNGDDDFDDFVSIEIAEPQLESVRRRCYDVVLAPNDEFLRVIRKLLAELETSGS